MTHKPVSRGDMISTLCFLGVGLWSLGTAIDATPLKSVALLACAAACFAGAARHQIARVFRRK